jgi:hypothetical protein
MCESRDESSFSIGIPTSSTPSTPAMCVLNCIVSSGSTAPLPGKREKKFNILIIKTRKLAAVI